MDNVRYNISPCSPNEVREFIDKIDVSVYVPNGAIKANDRSHYDRYSFLCNENRVAVVYDTTASIISITGRQDYAKTLLDLFAPNSEKSIKQSTVPAQQSSSAKPAVNVADKPTKPERPSAVAVDGITPGTRAKLFVPPERIRRRTESAPAPTIIATYRGAELSTDEIYPPQVVKRRPPEAQREQPERNGNAYGVRNANSNTGSAYGGSAYSERTATANPRFFGGKPMETSRGAMQTAASAATDDGAPTIRRARISFGDEEDDMRDNRAVRAPLRGGTGVFGDDGGNGGNGVKSDIVFHGGDEELVDDVASRLAAQPQKRKRGRPPKADKQGVAAKPVDTTVPAVRRRGRPRKMDMAQNDYVSVETPVIAPEYKNGYSVKNYPPEALSGVLKRLKEDGKGVTADSTEFAGTVQEVRSYTVSDTAGQRVILRYATKKMTLQLQGKRSDLFGEVQSQVSRDSDYSSALEGYVEATADGKQSKSKVSDVQARLKKRLPTAFGYLSEQSRIDFSYGIHDFGMSDLRLSDYSVLLVPAFRGLERFIFDLQRAEGIRVKMIGQAFDKDDSGKYILKSGYTQRIDSVIYAEVMVSLYTEYFSRRNFFAHSDNGDDGVSRSIADRATAKRIFDSLLDLVEYNSKKLKEIGFSIDKQG